ncbi:MAG: hypothetical protein WCC64_17030 [Aliidongia sp.]
MPIVEKASRKPGGSIVPGSITLQEGVGTSEAGEAQITLDGAIWKGLMTHQSALKMVLTGFGEAIQRSEELDTGVRLTVVIQPHQEAATVEIDTVHAPESSGAMDAFEVALAEARVRGGKRAAEILTSAEMLSADAFADMIGVSREAVRLKRRRHEVLGIEGAKRGARFPRWQVTEDGGLLPGLSALFERLDGNSWTVYRFLIQHHPELDGSTAADALKAGKIESVLAAAENASQAFS